MAAALISRAGAGEARKRYRRLRRGRLHHIHRQVDVARAGSATFGGAEGIGHDFRDLIGGADADRVFRHPLHDRDGIHRLMDVLVRIGDRHRAAKGENRIALAVGGGEPGHEVGDAGAGGRDADAGLASHPADAAGDEGRILLMAADNRLDLRGHQRIEDGIDLRIRNAEDMRYAAIFKRANHEIGADLGRDLFIGHDFPRRLVQ